MVNFNLNAGSLMGILLAFGGIGLYFLRSFRPNLTRDYDVFFTAIGLLCGGIFFFHSWRLDPILQFGVFLLTGSSVFFATDSVRLRGIATEQAKRGTPVVNDSQTQASHQIDQIEALEKQVSLLQGLVANLHKQLESQTNDSPSPQINNPDPIQTIIDRFQTSPKDFFESGERIKALTPDQESKLLTLTPQQASPVVLIRVSDRGGYLIPKPGYNTYTKFEPYFELEDDQFHGDLQLLEPAHVSPLRDRWMLEKKGKISFSSL